MTNKNANSQFFSKATWSKLLLIILGQILEIGFMQINILVILHIEFNSQFNPVKINCKQLLFIYVYMYIYIQIWIIITTENMPQKEVVCIEMTEECTVWCKLFVVCLQSGMESAAW